MRDGRTFHEVKTFDTKAAAKNWMRQREAELCRPSALETPAVQGPPPAEGIGRHIAENMNRPEAFSMTDDRLWTTREPASFLGYSDKTVARMVSQAPEKLPPRVLSLSRPRWLPSVVREWVLNGHRKKE
jgi:predicted DNA-binding transcriptional regulator AlpA